MVGLAVDDAIKIPLDGPNVGRDRHLIVIEYDEHLLLEMTEVIDTFQGHASRQSGIAHYCDHVEVLASQIASHRHTQRAGNRRAGVRHVESVVRAFVAYRKAGDASVLADGREAIASAGDDLMSISLVAHVPNDLVARRVEAVVQCQR